MTRKRFMWDPVSAVGLLLATVVAIAGCGDDFPDPPPAELDAIGETNPLPPTRTVGVVLTGRKTPDRQVWVATAMREGAAARAIVLVDRPEPEDPPARQAAVVRKMAGRNIDALVVEPEDDPEVLSALNEAHDRGIPIVMIGRKVPINVAPGASAGEPPPPVAFVDYLPFETAARNVAEALKRDAEASEVPADAHAILCLNADYGPEAVDRAARLAVALGSVGFGPVETVSFSDDYTKGRDELVARLEADPKAQIILALDDKGLSALLEAKGAFKGRRAISLAGILSLDQALNPTVLPQCVVIVDRNSAALGREAVRFALRLAGGGPVPTPELSRVVNMPTFGHSPGAALVAEPAGPLPAGVNPGRPD